MIGVKDKMKIKVFSPLSGHEVEVEREREGEKREPRVSATDEP